MLPRIALTLLLISTASCAPESFSPTLTTVCPPVREYTAEQQTQLANELAQIRADSMTVRFLNDYATERAMLRACQPKP